MFSTYILKVHIYYKPCQVIQSLVHVLTENTLIARFGKQKLHINGHLLPAPNINLGLSWKQVSFCFDNLLTPILWK